MDRIPYRLFKIGKEHAVDLRGDLAASIAYNDLADGKGLEDAFDALKPTMRRHQDGEKLPPVNPHDRRAYLDLLWCFSATWREEQGWDDKDEQAGADLLPPKKRPSYKRFKRLLNQADVRRLRHCIIPLLMEAIFPPGEAVPEAVMRDLERPELASS